MRGSTLISASTSELASAANPMPRRVPALGLVSVTVSIEVSPRLTGVSSFTTFGFSVAAIIFSSFMM